jgi:hypothetical protein
MNRLLIASVLALLVLGSSAQASMSLASRQPVQPTFPTASGSTIATPSNATPSDPIPSDAKPSDTAPSKTDARVAPTTVTKPGVDTPRAANATDRSAGSKGRKTGQAEDRDERSEELSPRNARRAQRAADETKGDDDVRNPRKRGLEKIERMLELVRGMRPNLFARWR